MVDAARKVIKGVMAALALLGAMAGAASAQVPSEYARQLAQQLARGEQAFTQAGFARVAGPFAGELSMGAGRRIPITLRAGEDYRVLGVCDADCGDLDLRLYSGGVLVTQDVADDDTPVLSTVAPRTGAYEIDVVMAECDSAPCYYAVNVYGR